MYEVIMSLCQLWHGAAIARRKQRQRLRLRLIRMFQMDAISGSLESISRRFLLRGGVK